MLLLAAAAVLLFQDSLPPDPQFVHDAKVVTATMSPDGDLLAVLDEDGTLTGWRRKPRRRLYARRILAKGGPSRRLTCSPEGRYLAISSKELPSGPLLVVGLADGKDMRRFERGFSPAFSPDGELLACSDGRRIRRWAMKSGAELPDLPESPADLKWVAWSPAGTQIAASEQFGPTVLYWDLPHRELWVPATLAEGAPVASLAYTPDGTLIAVGGLWGALIRKPSIGPDPAGRTIEEYARGDLSFSSGGQQLMSSEHQRKVSLWDRGGLRQWHASVFHEGMVDVSAAGRFLIWMEGRGIRLERIPSFLGGPESGHWIETVAFTPDGKAVTGGRGGQVRLWDPETQNEVGRYDVPDRPLRGFSKDARMAVLGGGDQGIQLWDLAAGREVLTVEGKPAINAAAFSPDGKTIGLGLMDGSVSLWDIAARKEKDRIPWEGGAVQDLAWSPDGKTLAWGTSGGQVIFAEGEHGGERVVYARRGKSVRKVEFLNDGRRLWVVDQRGESLVYDGRLDHEPEAPTTELWVSEKVRDSRWMRTAEWKRMTESHAFSPDGRSAISTDGHGAAMIWQVPWSR